MNFLSAIKHAVIDYGIRRAAWHKDAILYLGNGSQGCEMYWLPRPEDNEHTVNQSPMRLCGPDKTLDIQPEDIVATDWEAI